MADNDSNIIKPVESMQNITGLTPARRREQGKHQGNLHEEESGESEQEANGSAEEQNLSDELMSKGDDKSTIDYCA
jgi:hypothetical protein